MLCASRWTDERLQMGGPLGHTTGHADPRHAHFVAAPAKQLRNAREVAGQPMAAHLDLVEAQ
jgi:hypothetical protein